MDRVVELKLAIGNDFTSAVILVGEDTILQGDDGVGIAFDLSLWRYRGSIANVEGSDFKGAHVVLVAAVGVLS